MGKVVGSSVFYDSSASIAASDAVSTAKPRNDLETLDSELKDGEKASKSAVESGFSSFVWICTSTHKESRCNSMKTGRLLIWYRCDIGLIRLLSTAILKILKFLLFVKQSCRG